MTIFDIILRKKLSVKVVNKFVLNGTIDGHDPIGVRFHIRGPEGKFYLTVISVNWGRGYTTVQFKNNVLRVLDRIDADEYAVLLIQELDEADQATEHKIFRKMMEPGTTLVEYATREPIAISPGIPVHREQKIMTMDQGSVIGAPTGTGPRRFYVSAVTTIKGVRVGFGNQHPHRNMPNAKVQAARRRGESVVKRELRDLASTADLVIDGGDLNDTNYPKSHPKQKIAFRRGIDYIRYIVA